MTPAEHAGLLYRRRRDRDDAFGADRDGFGEPAWDMLLWILAQGNGARSSVDAVIIAAAVPDDIARPYLTWLSSRRLIDLSGSDVALSEGGRVVLARYLETPDG